MKTSLHDLIWRLDFRSLSLRDLLEARDAYHLHLAALDSVVATAVGRFRIRRRDADAQRPAAREHAGYLSAAPRTLTNSVVRPWSWPCVLVFVNRWLSPAELAKHPDQTVPRLLHLPDGRVVPTCVVLVEESSRDAPPHFHFPDQLLGGGCPILSEPQGTLRTGTAGCLVTDGTRTLLLTGRHVAGPAGTEVFTLVDGHRRRLGRASATNAQRVDLPDAYPGLASVRARATLDAGLIELDTLNGWTSQIFGLGEVGEPLDLYAQTLSLDLIGCPVKACGAASGIVTGEIHALFYRYRNDGGIDDLTDFLIGPRTGQKSVSMRPGDSGAVWFLDEEALSGDGEKDKKRGEPRRLRPIALAWGGQVFASPGGSAWPFSLAANFTTVTRALGVEALRTWNTGYQLYWGQVGHYKIGHVACSLLASKKARALFSRNAALIGIDDATLTGMGRQALVDLSEKSFVPLADVPDEIWRNDPKRKAADESNHFADMDQEGAGEFAGKTLLDLCKDPANIQVKLWNQFYKSIGAKKRGAVPFRVWQIYDEMVAHLKKKNVHEFFCAAGVMAHYVGDCGQPLHISRLHHGGDESEKDVHGVYETEMLTRNRVELFKGLNDKLAGKRAKAAVKGGHAAAVATIDLMRATIKTLPPQTVLDSFNGSSGTERIPQMWQTLGKRTIDCMARASLTLATLWESAWVEGRGDALAASALGDLDPKKLRRLYEDPGFVKSFTLLQLEANNMLG